MAEQSEHQRVADDINMSLARIAERKSKSWGEFASFVQRMKAKQKPHDGSARSLANQAFIRELEIYVILKNSGLVDSQKTEQVDALILEIEAFNDEAQQKAG